MSRYRHKPLIVEAVRWDGTESCADFCRLLAGAAFLTVEPEASWDDDPDATAACRSDLHGGRWIGMRVGDYVVVDKEGRLYPLRKVIFEELYEEL